MRSYQSPTQGSGICLQPPSVSFGQDLASLKRPKHRLHSVTILIQYVNNLPLCFTGTNQICFDFFFLGGGNPSS